MKLFDLYATLALDTSEFDEGVTKSGSKFDTFGSKLSGGLSKLGGAAKNLLTSDFVGNIGSWIRDMADEASAAGDKIDKQSQALGMSRKAYQEWDYILSQSGASIDSLGVSMKTLNSAVLSDSKDTREVFKSLGLSMEELNGLTQESQFERVVRAFQQLPAGAEKSALAVKLFGRNGQDLLPLLNSSADSIDEMRKNAQELGLIMSDEAVDAAVAYNDALDDMDRTFKAVKYAVGTEFLPVLTGAFKKVASYTGGLLNAYKEEGFSGVFKKIGSDIGSAFANIQWPAWSDIKDRADSWWKNDIKPNLVNILVASFGIEEADAEKALTTIETFWKGFVGTAEAVLGVAFHVITGDWNAVGTDISSWWRDDVWPLIQDLFSVTFGIELPDWDTVAASITDGWNSVLKKIGAPLKIYVDIVMPFAKSVGSSIGIPEQSVERAADQFKEAFDDPKAYVDKVSDAMDAAGAKGLKDINDLTGGALSESVSEALGVGSFVDNWKRLFSGDNGLGSSGQSGHGGGSGQGFATGLDYVPYNDFPANLHEGEAVLTKVEATEWRRGDGQTGFDLAALGEIVEAAIARGMKGFGFYVDSQRLADATTEPISRNIADAAWAGRYAT